MSKVTLDQFQKCPDLENQSSISFLLVFNSHFLGLMHVYVNRFYMKKALGFESMKISLNFKVKIHLNFSRKIN